MISNINPNYAKEDVTMDDYTMEVNANNPDKTVEGMHDIVFAIMKDLTGLEEKNLIITECTLKLKAVEGPGIDSQEYIMHQDSELSIIVDKTSIDRINNFSDVKNKERRDLILFLEKVSDREADIIWMNEEEYVDFTVEFFKLYEKMIGRPYENDSDDYYDSREEINTIMEKENLKYKIRKLTGGIIRPYILDRLS